MFLRSSLLLIIFFLCGKLSAQNFYDQTTIQKIEITFPQPNWDYQMDTSKAGAEGYIMAQSVSINGVTFDSVGVKYKGNSSYNAANTKNPLHIELDSYKSQSYLGVKDIKLGNNYADPSMIREVLGYDILKNYMHCPQANFAKVYINGAYYGIYSNAESIGKPFYSDHYNSSGGVAVKCNPIVNPSPNAKSNLKYFATGDSSNYFNFYEIKSDYGWNFLRVLSDTVTNYQSKIAGNIDMDRAIWMLAFNNVVVNLDSYSGAFCQNYYLYKDNTNHYNPTIWDLNMSFGGFPYVGNSNSSLAQQSITGLQQLPINIHATDVYWPLINAVNGNPQYKRMLVAHMRTIINEFFSNSSYVTKAQQFQTLIDTSVQSDNAKFYSYSQFQNGLTANSSAGSYSVPGISNLMNARTSYLQSTTDFGYSTPTITTVAASTNSPAINSIVTIAANVTNANSTNVYLGYRTDATQKFTRILMYDDGAHNDGSSGDNVYGVDIMVTSTQTEYYIYAENNNAGMFSPQRAEHEYYTLMTDILQPSAGQVVINEFLAVNQTGELDDSGQHEDWIELYNTTNISLNLSGLYLSDSQANLQKYTFPNNTVIPANGFLTIWADEDKAKGSALHCNFKLSASGEQLVLSKGTTVLDSLSFGAQTADVSFGRCPNGTGSFAAIALPTYNESNCAVGIKELNLEQIAISIFPNPADQSISIIASSQSPLSLSISNSIGETVFEGTIYQTTEVNTSTFSQGIYFINISGKVFKLMIAH